MPWFSTCANGWNGYWRASCTVQNFSIIAPMEFKFARPSASQTDLKAQRHLTHPESTHDTSQHPHYRAPSHLQHNTSSLYFHPGIATAGHARSRADTKHHPQQNDLRGQLRKKERGEQSYLSTQQLRGNPFGTGPADVPRVQRPAQRGGMQRLHAAIGSTVYLLSVRSYHPSPNPPCSSSKSIRCYPCKLSPPPRHSLAGRLTVLDSLPLN
jgi:hypothetical protein